MMPSCMGVSVVVTAVLLAYAYQYNHHAPEFRLAEYPDPLAEYVASFPDDSAEDTRVRVFELPTPDELAPRLADLRAALTASRFYHNATDGDSRAVYGRLPPLPDYGLDWSRLSAAVRHWADDYDVGGLLRRLRRHPHFVTSVFRHDVHFLHVQRPPPADGAPNNRPPVLLLHGWPGSVVEFLGVLDDPALADVDLVVPSLVGFGFSAPPAVPGMDVVAHAQVYAALMARLGYSRYLVQGGDWGGMIAAAVAQVDAGACAGIHINFLPVIPSPRFMALPSLLLSPGDVAKAGFPPLSLAATMWDISGYLHLQATRPDTLSALLVQSPVALLTWQLEKFDAWTDTVTGRAGLTLPQIVDNVAWYWLTDSAATSTRIYKDHLTSGRGWAAQLSQVHVPTAVADFPFEMTRTPAAVAADKFTHLLSYTEFTAGGHFAAYERPAAMACAIAEFVRAVAQPDAPTMGCDARDGWADSVS